MPTAQVKISLVLNKDLVRCRGILRGILQHAHVRPEWVLHTIASSSASRLELLQQWRPDGIIAEVLSPEDEARLAALGVPTVSVSSVFEGSRLPQVVVDQRSVGNAVAAHLLQRHFHHFAFVGPPRRHDAAMQRAGFAEAVAAAGGTLGPPPPLPEGPTPGWSLLDRQMSDWLLALPKPCGLMLWDDDLGLWLTQLCRVAHLKVPDDVALVGVNDDTLNCELAEPSLSSLGVPLQQIGHAAASLLDDLLGGAPAPAAPRYVPHLDVTTRPSSDILTISDVDIVDAVRFIRANAHRKIGVSDVLGAVAISRRILEQKFRRHLDRTPLQEIRYTQVGLAKQLLARTDLSLKDIAGRIGFDNIYHLCRTFKQQTGKTPMQHRQQFRVR